MQNTDTTSEESNCEDVASDTNDDETNQECQCNIDDTKEDYEFGKYGYGKSHVKLLHVLRDGPQHSIREVELNILLTLNSTNHYVEGDNSDIIATDSQKNIIYILARKHGIKNLEEFGLLICDHFLDAYQHIAAVEVSMDEYPWERLQIEKEDHNHAFVFSPSATRFAIVNQTRNTLPKVKGGLKGLRVLKTTMSSFTGFIQDGYCTLPTTTNRIFSTEITAIWEFSTTNEVDFDRTWVKVKEYIIDKFAGPPNTGIFSPSVQNTLYTAQKMILDELSQIGRIEMTMPNKHYNIVDMSKFSSLFCEHHVNEEVYNPVDKPAGNIYAELLRKNIDE